jgi:hypothetical protein
MIKHTMLNFSSISLANARVKFTLFALSYALALCLYWPGMNGYPIWDDVSYWFYDPVMSPTFSYGMIWKNFTWPLSVSAQKLLYSMGGERFWIYHGTNFLLHCFNSWLVYRFLLLMRLRRSLAILGFLFFLIQPASVITVAWMIQFKTILCFTLAMGAIIFFVKARRKRDYAIAALFFFLSIISKSSSLSLPLALVFLLGKKWKTRKILTVIPFFLISLFGLWQISRSKVAMEAILSASEVTEKELTRTEPVAVAEPEPVKPQIAPETLPQIPQVAEVPEVTFEEISIDQKIVESNLSLEALSPVLAVSRLLTKTLHYYFWQAYLPLDISPVKGLNPFPPSASDYLHLFFLAIIAALTWGTYLFPALVSAHVFLLPYLGLIPAPYMNVTWVSDQHLYLALPSFILLLMGLIERGKSRWMLTPIFFLLIMFGFKTYQASGYYRNSIVFYEKSIETNLNNLPIIYNLSTMYLASGKNDEAYYLLQAFIEASKREPYLRDSRYFPFLVQMHSQINQSVDK